jgi:uncharacterized SAM-binding protein YcdF (DUF218 family)
MSIAARERLGRALVRTCASVLVVATLAAAAFLPFAGRFLVREDPLEPADAIFVLAGSRVSRWLEALELYREGRAPLVLLSPGRLERSEMALRERGIRLPTEGEIARDAMLQLNVPPDAIRVLPGSLDNTAHEAAALHAYWRSAPPERRMGRIIVVTSGYHTRRTRFAFRREFEGTPVGVLVRASRFDEAQPARWWRHRADVRFVTSELQKLVLYALGLGAET